MTEPHDDTAPDTSPAPAPEPYAPSTLCLKARVGDVEISWTLRGSDEETASRAQRVPHYLDQLKERRGAEDAPKAPATRHTGAVPRCTYHGPMKESTKAKGTWFCPKKMGDGAYCKERWPKDS